MLSCKKCAISSLMLTFCTKLHIYGIMYIIMEPIILEKPEKLAKSRVDDIFADYLSSPEIIGNIWKKTTEQRYLYWDRFRFSEPIVGHSITESWYLVKQLRHNYSHTTPVYDIDGEPYSIFITKEIQSMLDFIDSFLKESEKTWSDYDLTTWQKNAKLALIEESITSSQIEGANTGRDHALKMITTQASPRTRDEQMIRNNYQVMQDIAENYSREKLSISVIRELQAELTHGTLEDGFIPGEFRTDDDNIIVALGGKISYRTPPMDFASRELERLIVFANDGTEYHPVVKAIMLHFWFAYLHPFPDGNGRTARALFYWSLYRDGYKGIGYLSISSIIKRSQKNYALSYLYSEQDGHDFTYFLSYNLTRIITAIREFTDYLEKNYEDTKRYRHFLSHKYPELNIRQIDIMVFLKDKNHTTTMKECMEIYDVSRRTAYNDLDGLKALGLIIGSEKQSYRKAK